ncbi:MAG: hypothetical protein ACTSVY_12430 [Candidatus Helarchaeota archaeon]
MSDDTGDLNFPDILGDFEEIVLKNVDIEADDLTLEIPEEGASGEVIKKIIAQRVLQAISPFLQ